MKISKTFWFVFWLVTGLIIGSLLYNVCAQVSFLRWLTIGESISFSPAADLSILKFSLQMEFRLTLAQVVGVLVGLFCYHHFH